MRLVVLVRGTWVEPRKARPFVPGGRKGFLLRFFVRSSDVKEYRRMWRMLANPQKDVSIRRLTTGGATT
jgi:hypothetical protein